ncbi:hypothetical protein L2E82_21603 [Cichorium intybus]|uniref:Uncharacterized protein n=1 Tax=Cichorium intybus TaxID=13427 RepID=A0ACB9DW64_CICIN|nr:hypothetical protein L2E82_21603 [Cichorium intybus]
MICSAHQFRDCLCCGFCFGYTRLKVFSSSVKRYINFIRLLWIFSDFKQEIFLFIVIHNLKPASASHVVDAAQDLRGVPLQKQLWRKLNMWSNECYRHGFGYDF